MIGAIASSWFFQMLLDGFIVNSIRVARPLVLCRFRLFHLAVGMITVWLYVFGTHPKGLLEAFFRCKPGAAGD